MTTSFTPDSLPKAVTALLRLNGYEVTGPQQLHGAEVDLIARSQADPFANAIYIEVTTEHVDNDKYARDLTKLAMVPNVDQHARRLIVSSSGFSLPVAERAKKTGIETLTYDQLFAKFERFDPYLESVLRLGSKADALKELHAVYEEPEFYDVLGQHPVTPFLTEWRDNKSSDARWLIIVGDYGTGKTALTQVLQYRWLLDYRSDPSYPIPFRIELRDFTRQFDARGLLHHFLDYNGLGHLTVDFVLSLVRSGRVVLLLDGYDEMAQYLHARERRVCLEALAELSSGGARGILTSRPNYFSESEELQVFEVLYSAITQQQLYLTEPDRSFVQREREVDELIESHFLNRHERILKDLSPEQTESLVRRRLRDDPAGRDVVLGILQRVFRGMHEAADVSLSGKPVIIAYLLQVVDELKNQEVSVPESSLTEWQLYKLVIDHLMMRDYRRSQFVMPDRRRAFLQALSQWLSKRDNSFIEEGQFRELIRRFFSKELRRCLPEDRDRLVDNYFADLRSSATLTRAETRGKGSGWRFSHNSLREFLLTEYVLLGLQSGEVVDMQVPISDPMRLFAASQSREEITRHFRALAARWPQRHDQYGLGELLVLLWDALRSLFSADDDPVRSCLVALSGEKVALDGIALKRLVISSEGKPTSLRDSSFQGSELTDVMFVGADCRGGDFSQCLLENVSFSSANLRDASFAGGVLVDVNLSGADLQGCDFRGMDAESTILAESPSAAEGITRMSGKSALGYLRYHGGTTDAVSKRFIYSHFPKFAIVEKICSVMTSQSIHQRLGLEKRGTSQLDPRFASAFVEHLVKNGLAQTKKNRPGMVWTTARGRELLARFCEGGELPQVLEDFLTEHV